MTTYTPASPAARGQLLSFIGPKSNVYTVLRHVSASGMTRRISLFVVDRESGRVFCIDGLAARLLGRRVHDKGGIVTAGCGMDMGFDLVYRLGNALWPEGTPEPHGTRNGVPDRDGGYALKHEWL